MTSEIQTAKMEEARTQISQQRRKTIDQTAEIVDLSFIDGNGQRDECLMRFKIVKLALIIWTQFTVSSLYIA